MSIERLALALGTLHVEDRWRVSQIINEIAPSHWARVRLHEVATVQNGFPFESRWFNPRSGMPLIRIRDIGADDTDTFYSGDYDSAYIVHPGDVLVGMDGDFRCRRWRGRVALLNQRVCRIKFSSPEIDEQFAYTLLQPYLQAVQYATSSLTVAHLSSKTVEQLELLLPPLAEQKRIVAKIDELSARRTRANAALDAVPPLLDKLRHSILAAAFRGDLTADWRARNPNVESAEKLLVRIGGERRRHWEAVELARLAAKGKSPTKDAWKDKYVEPVGLNESELPTLPSTWCWTFLDMIASVTGGITKGQKRAPGDDLREVPYLRVANVQRGHLDLDEVRTILALPEEIEQLRLLPGDVLLNEGGDRDKLGRGWVWSGEIDVCIYQNHVFRARPLRGSLESKLISWFGNTFGQPFFIDEGKQTTNLASVSLTKVKRLPLPLMPTEEQTVLVRILEQQLAAVERLEQLLGRTTDQLLQLDKSMLAKAFRGELVPQEPNDEPASLLLERIRAAHQETPDAGSQRRSKKAAIARK